MVVTPQTLELNISRDCFEAIVLRVYGVKGNGFGASQRKDPSTY